MYKQATTAPSPSKSLSCPLEPSPCPPPAPINHSSVFHPYRAAFFRTAQKWDNTVGTFSSLPSFTQHHASIRAHRAFHHREVSHRTDGPAIHQLKDKQGVFFFGSDKRSFYKHVCPGFYATGSFIHLSQQKMDSKFTLPSETTQKLGTERLSDPGHEGARGRDLRADKHATRPTSVTGRDRTGRDGTGQRGWQHQRRGYKARRAHLPSPGAQRASQGEFGGPAEGTPQLLACSQRRARKETTRS